MAVDQIEKLRNVKERQGLSYDELGKQIGVHSQSVYRWLKGNKPPKSRAVRKALDQFLRKVSTSGGKRAAARKSSTRSGKQR